MKPGILPVSFLLQVLLWPALAVRREHSAVETREEQQRQQPLTTSWRAEPNGRGTFSLVFSCIVTLTLCVWSALHLNIPPPHRGLRWRFLEKTKWVLYGVFAPELVVATAAAQFIVASWLKKEIEADAETRRSNPDKGLSSHTWDMTQCLYAAMGGLAANIPGVDGQVTVTPEGIRLLSFLGRLPQIDEAHIEDKSKADWMAKGIICIQAGWMVAQVIGRAIKHLPISLLEINTCGHVACALVIYILWWNKPLDVQVPTMLGDGDNDILALMYLCSSTSAVDGITDIRCFVHVVNEEGERLWDPSRREGDTEAATATGASPEAQGNSKSQLTTYFSIGSPGSRNPSHFLGIGDLRSESDSAGKERAKSKAVTYIFNLQSPSIASRCQVYYSMPYTNLSLRHSRYCRRAIQDAADARSARAPNHTRGTTPPPIPAPDPLSHGILAAASRAADLLRTACGARPAYEPYYFTFVPQLGHFLGETDYVARPHLANFPSLHNLGLGQVNIHRDRLRSVLALAAAAYGALHCASLASSSGQEQLFPTVVERALWTASALTIAASGLLLWGFFSARQAWPAFDRWVSGAAPGVHIASVRASKRWVIRAKTGVVYVMLGVFALARVFLVVEAFVSLRRAPLGLYETPEWTDFLPHL